MVGNRDLEEPLVFEAGMFSKMPNRLRRPGANCKLQGAAFDRAGNLFLSDTPSGRILRLSRAGQWELVVETGGSPQGIAVHHDVRIPRHGGHDSTLMKVCERRTSTR